MSFVVGIFMAIVHHIWTEYFIACDNKRKLKIHYNPSRRFVCRESFLKLLLSKITHLRLTTAPHNKICSQKVRAQSGVQLKGRIWLSGKQNNNEKKKKNLVVKSKAKGRQYSKSLNIHRWTQTWTGLRKSAMYGARWEKWIMIVYGWTKSILPTRI